MSRRKIGFALFCTALIFLCGCASSDRMVRMSGGVLDEYSAPPKHRVRSARFQKKSDVLVPAGRGKRENISDFNAPLVNIWPFFFRSQNYFSILWPFIDWDAYGLAVRPFYNQEGDEYSILFPLSAWNSVNGDGWILNCAWAEDGFGFVPLSWQHSSKEEFWCYYTPLFIYYKNHRPMERVNYDDMSAFCLLWFMDRDRKKVMSGDMSTFYWGRGSVAELRYIAAKNKWDMPKDFSSENRRKFVKKLYDMAPEVSETSYGIFPLFHICSKDDGCQWRALAYLTGGEHFKDRCNWDILWGLIADYTYDEYNKVPEFAGNKKKSESFSGLMLFDLWNVEYYPDQEIFKTFKRVSNAAGKSDVFSFNYYLVKEELAKVSPGTVIPPEVTDNASLRRFVRDWQIEFAKDKKLKTALRHGGGFFPLFSYESDTDKYKWFSAAALSRYYRDKDSWTFWSVPLLTYMTEAEFFSFKGILPPLGWMSFEKRSDHSSSFLPIKSRDTKFVQSWECVETIDDYALCGLFYKGKTRFFVAAEGVDARETAKFSGMIRQINSQFSYLKSKREKYKTELAKVEKWKPANKIDHYKKLIRLEELAAEDASIRKMEVENESEIRKAEKSAELLKFKFNVDELRTRKGLTEVKKRMFDQLAEVREKEDIGNGFFFRKEKFYNGDYKWHLLYFLAGGEKQGKSETVQVLQFLYRKRVEGDKSETLFFPFVSIIKDGKKERSSFLGRIWQKTEINGKSGGYIFFIPWGEKICQ